MVAIVLLYFTQPNFYRAFTPTLFGIEKVAPRVFTDRPDRLASIQRAIKAAEENAAVFFPNQTASPSYIVCFTTKCTDVFGPLPLGLTLGFHRIIIAPNGFNTRVFNHERVHIELHALMDLSDLLAPRYPVWFNEGLAEFLSGSKCLSVLPTAQSIARVKQAVTMRQWNDMVSDKQYRRHYGSACRAVEKIVQFTGEKRLSELVHNAKSRRQFIESLPF